MKIGLITKPQGIKGEVRVSPLTDDAERFYALKEAFIDGVRYKVLRARVCDGFVVLALSGVADRNDAETLRGKFLYVDRENAVELKPGTYFIADVEGCKLKTETGEVLGTVTEIISAKTDIFTVKTVDGRIMRFPFLNDAVIGVDVQNETVTVNAKRLAEISCYED